MKAVYGWSGTDVTGHEYSGFFVADPSAVAPVLDIALLGLSVLLPLHDDGGVERVMVTSDRIQLLCTDEVAPQVVAFFEEVVIPRMEAPNLLEEALVQLYFAGVTTEPPDGQGELTKVPDPYEWDVSAFPLDVHVPDEDAEDE